MNLADIEVAICCEGDTCRHPENCYLKTPGQCVPVRVDLAARAVQTLCARWQTEQQRRAVPIEGAFFG